ncbi:MAG: RNA 2',3'-cyclic phosphodiesterase [Chloroflexi bacterium]|nr:RNA 2',3'-cyclic phosphodiesterase [Chloroflexota bacterium]
MPESLRAFIAIEIPQNVLDYLRRIQDAVRAGRFSSVTWVRPEGIHLTLKFLGNISQGQVPQVVAAMETSARGQTPFRLEVHGLGAFPSMDRARVLWVGVQGNAQAVASIQAKLEATLAALGFPREDRPFSPHLTLGRVRPASGGPPAERKRLGSVVAAAPLEKGIVFDVASLSLMQSTLTSTGAIYTRLAEVSLAGEKEGQS